MRLIESYKSLGHKEFMTRWKDGMANITPLQQTNVTILGQVIVIIGVILGIVFSAKAHLWWMLIILSGALLVGFVQLLGAWQKRYMFISFEKQMKGGEDNEKNNINTS